MSKDLRKSPNITTENTPSLNKRSSNWYNSLLHNNGNNKTVIVFFITLFIGTLIIFLLNWTYLSRSGGLFYITQPGKIPEKVVLEQINDQKTIFLPRNNLGTYQRAYKKIMLTMRQKPRVMVLGSSHAIKITHDLFNVEPEEFYNAGLISATTTDFLSMWQVAKEQDKLPELVIYVCASHDFRGLRNEFFYKEFFELNRRRYSYDDNSLAKKYFTLTGLTLKDNWKILKFAMRSSVLGNMAIDTLEDLGLNTRSSQFRLEEKGVMLENGWGYNFDGSMIYDSELELRDVETNRKEIMSGTSEEYIAEYKDLEISKEDVELLKVFLRDARENNVKVLFLLPPYNDFGLTVISEHGPDYLNWINRVRDQITELSKDYSVESYLTINSSFYKCGDDEYTGASHPKTSCFKKIVSHIRESTGSPLIRELIKTDRDI